MPAEAITKPWWVCTIRVGPRLATTRAVSAARTSSRAASRSGPSAGTSTSRPSALETILLVTTSTSPSRSHGAAVGDQRGQVVTLGHVADAEHRQDLQPHVNSTAARTMAAVAASSVIRSGTARTVTPGTTAPASSSATSQPSSRPPSGRPP